PRMRFGLRARIVVTLVGLVVVTMAAVTLTSVAGESELRQRAAEAQLAHCAMLLALHSPLLGGAGDETDWRRFQETLQRAERIRLTHRGSVFEMAYAAGFDSAGAVRSRTLNRRLIELRMADGSAPPVTTRRAVAALIDALERDNHGLLIVRVERRGGPLLEVGYSRTQISAELRGMGLRAAWLTLAFSLLAAVIGHLLATRLARPIEHLAAAMEQVAAGDLDAGVSIDRADEVGVLAAAFNHMIEGLRERERIRDRFGRYVSPDVVAKILSDPEQVSIAGERREVAVLFVDIRGFTTLAESLRPDDVVELVNGVFAAVWGPVCRWGGTIDKFLGDGVMILFNAP
ncbi:MAG: HAMP domain-containing protein, partial [Rubrivivax sp.]|nr:HAMP domain-containing protein [Rubrivivax sp.]